LLGLALAPAAVFGQADTTRVRLRLRFDVSMLQLVEPPAIRAPWLGAPARPAAALSAWDSAWARRSVQGNRERRTQYRLLAIYGRRQLAPTELEADARGRRGFLGVSQRYADLDLEGQARLEIRTDRLRNERCTAAALLNPNSGCRGNFKAPRIDNEFSILAGGLIGRRFHIDVDYDSQREFNANNNIHVYYQGLQDEIVQRVDVGTVTFRPPPSRFITAAIPSNNFGINALFEVGPVQIQTLAATQKGSVVGERVYTIGQTTSQPQDRQLRDLDFEAGRFFWVVDPINLPGYPAIDILNLSQVPVSDDLVPTDALVYRYRPRQGKTGIDENLDGINAFATTPGSTGGIGARWELLLQGTDYYLDPSGLWFALGTKLSNDTDYLAVSYVTRSGTQVGTQPRQDRGFGPNGEFLDTLRIIVRPRTGSQEPIFRHEMRQIYRIAGTDLDRASLRVKLSLNRSERPFTPPPATYLALLGIAIPTAHDVFDIDNRLFPRTRDPNAELVVRESFIIFPHLIPFADTTKLATAAERSDSLYRTPGYLVLGTQGPASKFEFRLQYEAAGGEERSSLNLNALQVREGSESLIYNGRKLERDVDYSISYELGQVTFLDPEVLFGSGTAQLVARFEERGIFAVAPTTILGLTTRYSLGDRGSVNLMGLYQQEQTAFTRPPLGFEPTASLIGGITADLRFQPLAVTRFLNRLTTRETNAPSVLDLNAEYAFSRPVANRIGEAFLEEFEADASRLISLNEASWEFGSLPHRADGILLPGFQAGFDSTDAVQMTWQNLVIQNNQVVEVRPQDIDPNILIIGRGERQETVMYLTFHADTAGGVVQRDNTSRWSLPTRPNRPRWRSMVTALSPSGIDLSASEFLEFWVFREGAGSLENAGLELVVDLGNVDEDALAFAPDSLLDNGSDTTYVGRQFVGVGQLDTERSSIGIFNADIDDIGILGDRPPSLTTPAGPIGGIALCQRQLTTAVEVLPWGDLNSRCTNGNGLLDTEDLNNDDLLNFNSPTVVENVFRWVIDPSELSPYFVRDGVSTTDGQGRVSKWSLYRVPLRNPETTIGTPNIRLIPHLRITAIAAPDNGVDPDVIARFALARTRFTGAAWIRRSEAPVAGIAGNVGLPDGEVVASTVTTEDVDLGYEPPPGVIEGADRKDAGQAAQGTQANEKSLRILADPVDVGERAEAYLRFPSGTQSMLKYRGLRLWMRGRGEGWENGDLKAFVKLGSDENNFYYYQTDSRTTTWEPEVVVDLEVWRRLRSEVEVRWLRGEVPSGAAACGLGDSTAFVACDGPYLVHVRDPGINPPNLAAVQEVSAGVLRVGLSGATSSVELWVDDIRLTEPVNEVGTALALDARLRAADVGDLRVGFVRRGGQFRQIGQEPTFRTTNQLVIGSRVELDRFLPQALGLAVPVTVNYTRSSASLELLSGTDLRGADLAGLRSPDSWNATYTLAINRRERGTGWVTRGFIDPLSVSASLTRGSAQAELSQTSSNSSQIVVNYLLTLSRKGTRLPLAGLVNSLPGWFQNSELGKGLRNATFALAPVNLRFSSRLTRNEATRFSYLVSVERPDDALIRPVQSLTHLWRNAVGITLQPFSMLRLGGDVASTRDLRRYSDSTSLGRLATESRRQFLGMATGVERDRTISTTIGLSPKVSSWFRPRFSTSSSFVLSRSLTSRSPVQVEGDTAGVFVLPQTLNNSRRREIGLAIEPNNLIRLVAGDSSGLTAATARLRPIDISFRRTRNSTYDLAAFDPSLSYQLGLGGFNDFLFQNGTPARGASEIRTTAVTSGWNFPFGLTANLSYSLSKTSRLTRVGDGFLESNTRSRDWPVGDVRWTQTLGKGPVTLVGVGATFRRREGSTVQPSASGGVASININNSSALTPDLRFVFRNGLSMVISYGKIDGTTRSGGNVTEADDRNLTASVNYSFRLPQRISRRRKIVRASLFALDVSRTSCLLLRGGTECTTVSEVRRQEIRGDMNTDISRLLTAGFQFSYTINDVVHLNRRTSQIQFSLSFQLSLFSGDLR
jgi:hypothetical protein